MKQAKRSEIEAMCEIIGFDLEEKYMVELIESYSEVVEPMINRIKRGRNRADEPAHTFDPRKFMPLC